MLYLTFEFCPSEQCLWFRSSGDYTDDDEKLYGKWAYGPLDDAAEPSKEVISLLHYFLRRERGY